MTARLRLRPNDGFLTGWHADRAALPADAAPDAFTAFLWARHHLSQAARLSRRDAAQVLGCALGGQIARAALAGIRSGQNWQTALERAAIRAAQALQDTQPAAPGWTPSDLGPALAAWLRPDTAGPGMIDSGPDGRAEA